MNHKLILGTVQFGLAYGINNRRGQPNEFEVSNILNHAILNGVNILDTADAYGNAMERIGQFHQKTGKVFNINTKFRIDASRSNTDQLRKSLDKLSVKFIDTYFYHSFTDYFNNPSVMSELQALKEEGIIKSVGVSVYSNEEMKHCIDDSNVDVIQLPFNLLDNNNQRTKHIEQAKLKGKEIHVRSVFLQGLFFMNPADIPPKLLSLLPYLESLWSIARDSEIDIARLALAYVKQNPLIDKIIIGVDSEKQLADNLLDMAFELEEDVYALVDNISVKETSILNPQNWQ